MRVFLALGSNRGDRAAHLQRALAGLAAAGVRLLRVSRLRLTAPVRAAGRAHFLNAVAEAETSLLPRRLLSRLRALERAAGRRQPRPRRGRAAPRALDLDLILYGTRRLQAPGLIVPHPRFARRRFVLDGLAELAPHLCPPGCARTVRQLQRRAPRR